MNKLLNSKLKKLETINSELQDIYLISIEGCTWLVMLPSVNNSSVLHGIGYGGPFYKTPNYKKSSHMNIYIQNHQIKLDCFINVSKSIREGSLSGNIKDIINMYCSDDANSRNLLIESLTQIFREKYKGRYDFI